MIRRLALATLLLATSALALAGDHATGDVLRAAISGNTVQGSMSASGAYAEHYTADGVIKAADYSGTWTISADSMCFVYDQAAPDCWTARIVGDQITWLKNGAEGGTGSILPGNPNGF